LLDIVASSSDIMLTVSEMFLLSAEIFQGSL